jgi:hypothetical protein
MSLAAEVERVQNQGAPADEEFRQQLEMVERAKKQQNDSAGAHPLREPDRGIDRSRELNPIGRPLIQRVAI